MSRHHNLRGQSEYCAEATARWRALDDYMTRPFTAAESVRPERLWGIERELSTHDDPSRVVTFGPSYYLQPDGSWRELTAEERAARDAMPKRFVTVTAVNREAGTFSVRGEQ